MPGFIKHVCFCTWSVGRCFDLKCMIIQLHTAMHSWQRREHLMTLSGNCGYSSLIPYQNLSGGSFFKVGCSVNSETMPTNFSSGYIKIHWSLLCFEWIFYPCMILWCYALVIWKILIYWVLQIFWMLNHCMYNFKKSHSLILPPIPLEKSLSTGKSQAHSGKYKI